MRKTLEEYGFIMFLAVVIITLSFIITPLGSKIKEYILGAHETGMEKTKNEIKAVNTRKNWAELEQTTQDGEFRVTVHTPSTTDEYEIYYQIETLNHTDFCEKEENPEAGCP